MDDSCMSKSLNTMTKPKYRKNTIEEKRAMRTSRRRRMRLKKNKDGLVKQVKQLKQQIETSKKETEKANSKIVTLKCMTRTFWERWRWEVEKRKEDLLMNSRVSSVHAGSKDRFDIHEIDPCLLRDPSCVRNEQEYYLGRGSFGVVALKMYRGIHVAVKQMHIKSALRDVQHEAEMTACLCHPFLPCLFGICTTTKPFKIVTQFHGFMGDHPLSITVRRELNQHKIGLKDIDWISICAQILEAVNYLHKSAEILHNDITGTNVLLGNLQQCTSAMDAIAGGYQILLIDLGKGTKVTQGKMYHLSHREKLSICKNFHTYHQKSLRGNTNNLL